jgi:hypothetical protein
MNIRYRLASFATFLLLVLGAMVPSNALAQRRFGSNLRNVPNVGFGCETAPILDPIFGTPIFASTGQTTCTFRSLGFFNNTTRIGSFVPSNGTITRVRVRSGANPAPLRVTIMQCSPGLCGTAVRFSRIFRPRPNRITTLNLNLPVRRTISQNPDLTVTQVIDAVALSAVGPGTLPLFATGTRGQFLDQTPLTQKWYPLTTLGVPRVEDATLTDGLELLMEWTFVPSRRPVN